MFSKKIFHFFEGFRSWKIRGTHSGQFWSKWPLWNLYVVFIRNSFALLKIDFENLLLFTFVNLCLIVSVELHVKLLIPNYWSSCLVSKVIETIICKKYSEKVFSCKSFSSKLFQLIFSNFYLSLLKISMLIRFIVQENWRLISLTR